MSTKPIDIEAANVFFHEITRGEAREFLDFPDHKLNDTISNLMPELLQDQRLQIRLVVNHQNPCGHAARSTRVSISLRSETKSIGLVNKASAPFSKALRLVSVSP